MNNISSQFKQIEHYCLVSLVASFPSVTWECSLDRAAVCTSKVMECYYRNWNISIKAWWNEELCGVEWTLALFQWVWSCGTTGADPVYTRG